MNDFNLPYRKPNIDWNEIEKWDRNYYLHNTQAQSEYIFLGVEAVDGNYLYFSDGTRLLDFQSQLVSDNMGHRHPRVHKEIKLAMERYGHIFFGLSSLNSSTNDRLSSLELFTSLLMPNSFRYL